MADRLGIIIIIIVMNPPKEGEGGRLPEGDIPRPSCSNIKFYNSITILLNPPTTCVFLNPISVASPLLPPPSSLRQPKSQINIVFGPQIVLCR